MLDIASNSTMVQMSKISRANFANNKKPLRILLHSEFGQIFWLRFGSKVQIYTNKSPKIIDAKFGNQEKPLDKITIV